MLSPQFVNGKDLRVEIGNLNKTGLFPEKIKTVGVKKEALQEAFLKGVESVPQGKGEGDDYVASEEEKKVPDSVFKFYNSIVQGTDPTPEEIAEMEKEKKTKTRPSGPSNEQMAYDMLKAGKSDDDFTKAFTARYGERGQKDAEFVKKRIAIYKKIAEKRIATETGTPAPTEAPEEAPEEAPAE